MTVGICGLGLIGGSMAKAYKASGHRVLGFDIDQATLGYCDLAGITDGVLDESTIGECELLFVALYPTASAHYLESVAHLISKDATVIDLCGTKVKICECGFALAKKHGFGIEIAEFCTPWFLDTDFAGIDPNIREKLSCSDRFVLHAPFSELFPCAIDPKVRAIAAERYRQVIRVAEGYGIRKIVVHGGYNPRIYFPIWYTEQSVLFWKKFLQ